MTLKEVGDCPGCGHHDQLHAGGGCYDCPGYFCGWRTLGVGNVWGVPPGWWHWSDLPTGKSFTVVPEEVDHEDGSRDIRS